MNRRHSALLLAAALGLLSCGPASAEGRETEIMRTFITSFREYLAGQIMPVFSYEKAGEDHAFQNWESAGVLVHAKRGPVQPARWQLGDGVRQTFERDLATLHPHARLTPELELFEVRLREVLEITQGDAFKPTREHFDTVHGKLRVRFHSLSHLADLAAASLGLDPGGRGTGNGQPELGFDGLNR